MSFQAMNIRKDQFKEIKTGCTILLRLLLLSYKYATLNRLRAFTSLNFLNMLKCKIASISGVQI